MKIEEIRSKTDAELAFDLENIKKDLFQVRFKTSIDSVGNTAQITHKRRAIARINTVLHERTIGIRKQEPSL